MASPHVAGVAALVKSLYPNYTAAELKTAILNQCDRVPALSYYVKYGARLNAANALNGAAYSDIESIKLNADEVTIKTHEQIRLTAEPVPFNVCDKSVVWTSSDESIATVNDDGVVLAGEKQGTAVITATSAENSTVTASCTVNVSGESVKIEFDDIKFKQAVIDSMNLISNLDIKDYPLIDMTEYKSFTLTSPIYDHDVEKLISLQASNYGINSMNGIEYFTNLNGLSCDNNEIRKLDLSMLDKLFYLECSNNLITQLKINPNASWSGLIIYNNYLDISKSSDIEKVISKIEELEEGFVMAEPQYSVSDIDSFAIEGEQNITMAQRDAILLHATINPLDLSAQGVDWQSSNPEIASVSFNGALVAKSSGTATITAVSQVNPKFSASIEVTVTDNTAEPVDFKNDHFKFITIAALRNFDDAYDDYTLQSPLYPDELSKITEFTIAIDDGDEQYYNSDILNLVSLENINVNSGGFADIDWRTLANLKKVTLNMQYPCESINLSGLTNLTDLTFNNKKGNFVTYFNVDDCVNLSNMYVNSLDIDFLDLSKSTKMKKLNISNTLIKHLNLGNMSNLETLSCSNNCIEELDLSGLDSLAEFDGSFNNMTELKLPTNNNKLFSFRCAYNYFDTSSGSQFIQDMDSLINRECYVEYLPQKTKKATPAIELSEKYLDMSVGDTNTFTAICDFENPTLEWSTSNSDVADVDEKGNITALSSGTTYITARQKDNVDISASALVRVFADTDGNGTEEAPYLLRTKEDILFLSGITTSGKISERRKFLDAYYELEPENGEYIDMEGAELVPIGYGYPSDFGEYTGYTKTFDGKDKEIKNFSINASGDDIVNSYFAIGFFSDISKDGKVKNLSISDAKINVTLTDDEKSHLNGADCGILAGQLLSNSTIKNVSVFGTITANGSLTGIGGVCGSGSGQLYSCAASVDITAENSSSVGGICGRATDEANLYNCYSVGNIHGGNNVGGIAGSGSYIFNCYSLGSVSGNENIAGIIGSLGTNTGWLGNCFSGAAVSGKENVGAIVGSTALSADLMTDLYSLEGQIVDGEQSNNIGRNMTFVQLYNEELIPLFFGNSEVQFFKNEKNHNPKLYKFEENTLVANQPDIVMTDMVDFEIDDNVVTAKLKFEKTTPPQQDDICMYVAYKENEILKRIEQPEIADMTAEFTVPEELQNYDIYVYVWDKDMNPLMYVQMFKN